MVKFILVLGLSFSFSLWGEVMCLLPFYKFQDKSDYEFISRVYDFAKKAHGGTLRKLEGKPYIIHPERVAGDVLKYTRDRDMIAAALLHDVVEDTSISLKVIELTFNKRIAGFVAELTSDQKTIKLLGKTNYLIKKFNRLSDEALLIKLLDRKDNLQDLAFGSKEFQKTYAKSTLEIINSLDRRLTPIQKEVISEIKLKIGPYLSN